MRHRAFFSVILSLCIFAAGVAVYTYATPRAQALVDENCVTSEGIAPGPCVFGGVVLHPPVPCLGTGLFVTTIAAFISPFVPPVPLPIVFGPSEFLYFLITNPGQFVLGRSEGLVGRCATSPTTLVTGAALTGAPLVWPAAFYGTSPQGT